MKATGGTVGCSEADGSVIETEPETDTTEIFFFSASTGYEERQFRPDNWVPPETMSYSEQRHLLTSQSYKRIYEEEEWRKRLCLILKVVHEKITAVREENSDIHGR